MNVYDSVMSVSCIDSSDRWNHHPASSSTAERGRGRGGGGGGEGGRERFDSFILYTLSHLAVEGILTSLPLLSLCPSLPPPPLCVGLTVE